MLITPEYQQEQRDMHEKYDLYGSASIGYAAQIDALIQHCHVPEILDYGSGKGRLVEHLKEPVRVVEYDPAIKGKEMDPGGPFRLVVCIDVLEHIEPDCLEDVLDDLQAKTKKHLFVTIHTGRADKELSDGRNAHLTIQPLRWWLPKLCERFDIEQVQEIQNGCWTLLRTIGKARTNGNATDQ